MQNYYERFVVISTSLLEFAATWWMQATILLLVGLACGRALRRRGAALESLVYRVTLCSVILCPLAAQLLSRTGMSLLTIDLRSRILVSADQQSGIRSDSFPREITSAAESTAAPRGVEPRAPIESPDTTPAASSDRAGATANDAAQAIHITAEQTETPIGLAPAGWADSEETYRSISAVGVCLFGGIWLLGTVILMVKIFADLSRGRTLTRSASPADDRALQACRDVAHELRVRVPAVVQSPFLDSPCLLGHWRPVVLLPEETEPMTYHQVFLHELAHLRRGDWLWSIVARGTSAWLWCLPWMWWLVQRNDAAAEEVCDDYVLVHGGNREGYVRQLVEIAERSVPRLEVVGVSMVRFRSRLGQRVARILDSTRALSTRASRWLVGFAIVGTIAATASVALLHIGEPEVVANEKELATATTPHPPESVAEARTYRGQVLLPNGEPAAGANIYLVHWIPTPLKRLESKVRAIADAGGHFEFTAEIDPFGELPSGTIVATHPGYAFAWAIAAALETSADFAKWFENAPANVRETLQHDRGPMKFLPDDHVVSGHVVNSEGIGIAGISVYVKEVLGGPDHTMAAWDQVMQGPNPDYLKLQQAMTRTLRGPAVPSLFPEVRTDAHGRFTLRGIGPQRIVKLVLHGENIVTASICVRTSGDNGVIVLPQHVSDDSGAFTYEFHGPSFTLVAQSSRPVTGRVADQTGTGIAGAAITSMRSAHQSLEGNKVVSIRTGSDDVVAVTDAEGKYVLHGLPIARMNVLSITPPSDSSFLPTSGVVDTNGGENNAAERQRAVNKDFSLERGLFVTGRITDASTGKGVAGQFRFARPSGGADSFTAASSLIQRSDFGGTFRIVVPRAVGTLVFNAFEHHKYRRNPSRKMDADNSRLTISDGVVMWDGRDVVQGHAALSLAGTEEGELHADFQLQPSSILTGRAVDESGRELSNITCSGQAPPLTPMSPMWWMESSTGRIDIYDLEADRQRRVIALHRGNRLSGMCMVNAGDTGFEVRLEPWGIVKGRLLDVDGDPLARVNIESVARDFQLVLASPAEAMESRKKQEHPVPLPPGTNDMNPQYITDSDGRFEISGLVAGATYHLAGFSRSSDSNIFATDLVLNPGETRDLGDVVLKKREVPPSRQPAQGTEVTGLRSPTVAAAHAYSGRVENPDGTPASGAHVALMATKLEGQVWTSSETLAESTTDAQGQYELPVHGATESSHTNAHVVIRNAGVGIAWKRIALRQARHDAGTTKLEPEQLIQVRLVDLEGRPATQLQVQLRAIIIPSTAKSLFEQGLGFFQLDRPPAAWLPDLTTDANGLLTISNIASGHGVFLQVRPNDSFAPQDLALNTGMPEERSENDGTHRGIVKNLKPGEVTTIPLAPAKIFEGVVLLGDNGPPAADSRIEIWASQQEFGSMVSIEGKTDAQGRFRVNPYAGIRFGIKAYPPDGSPYQIAQLDDLRWTSGREAKEIKIVLPRGILATGRVVDADSGEPIENVSVQYDPMATNPQRSRGIVTGWQGIRKTNKLGEFQIPVLPDAGWLLFHANDRNYILQEMHQQQLAYDKLGGSRIYAHQFAKISPNVDRPFEPLRIELKKGGRIRIEVTDPEGNPVDDALAISRLTILATASGRWRGGAADRVSAGYIELTGLKPNESYPIYLLDPQRQLGAVTTVNAQQLANSVTLRPCGAATIRYVNSKGEPLAGKNLGFYLVVTPGLGRLEAMSNRDEVLADEDFAANIDRLNHGENPTDDQGRLVLQALIPGATYRYSTGGKQSGTFVAKSGETIDLGVVTLDLN